MEVKFFNNLQNNLHFSAYKNSKYSNEYTINNILDNIMAQNTPPSSLDLEDDASIYKYSKGQIRDLYKYFGLGVHQDMSRYAKKAYKKQIDTIVSKVSDGSVNSSNMEMILDLVKSKKLTPEILYSFYQGGQISRLVNDDLDKLYGAYAEGKNVKDVFVPKFNSKDEASDNIKIGDVCQIEGEDNISTKLPDGTIEELFITPETYLELFPPVERFIVKQSHSMGDCYLLAALDSINQNPNSRHKILEVFRQNPDGTVDAAFGGFKKDDDGKIVQKNPKNTVLKDISAQIHNNLKADIMSYTTEGFRAIELLNEAERTQTAKKDISAQYEKFIKFSQSIKTGDLIQDEKFLKEYKKGIKDDFDLFYITRLLEDKDNNAIFYNNFIYTKDEIDMFLSFINDNADIISTNNLQDIETIKFDMAVQIYEDASNKDDKDSKYTKLIMERYLEYMKRNNLDKTEFYNEYLPRNVYCKIFNKTFEKSFYNNSGLISEIYEKFGIKTLYKDVDPAILARELSTLDSKDHIFNCSSDIIRKKGQFYSYHGYSLLPIDTDDGKRFIVRNPHNSMYEVVLNYNDLCKNFNKVIIGCLKD